ncbi:MAG TPA: DUF72 domain-containing protein [Candidatus Polarisedimenticolia bacterium]|jgi:uncharacterized protein YecE (DUF72 family)
MRVLHPNLYLGTSSWSSKDWEGVFYPPGTPPGDYLAHYAARLRSVEVDSTFYRAPSAALVRRWRDVLPAGFLLAAKVPQEITHERKLAGCAQEFKEFVSAMDLLEDRLGPMLFQFPYYSKASGMTQEGFLERVRGFLPQLPAGHRFALEIRNKGWLKPALLDLLRGRSVALTLIDHPWMPPVDQVLDELDPVTADFSYVRWLGDRKGIEERTKTWDTAIVDRGREMRTWVPAIRALLARRVTVFGFFNNHYAGHAPASVALFEKTWEELPVSGPEGG